MQVLTEEDMEELAKEHKNIIKEKSSYVFFTITYRYLSHMQWVIFF